MINNPLLNSKKISAIYFAINGNMVAQTNEKTGDVMSWFVEGVSYSGNNTPAHTFLNVGGEGMIKSSDRFIGLTTLILNSCNLASLDVNILSGSKFPANFQVASNKLVNLVIPDSDNTITVFYAYLNPQLTSLDLSNLTGLGGGIQVHSCPLLATITLPTSNRAITAFYAYSNPELTSLNLSSLTGLGGSILLYFCGKLSSVVFPNSASSFSRLECYQTIVTSWNLSGFSNVSSGFICRFAADSSTTINSATTSIILPIHATATVRLMNFSYHTNLGYVDFKSLPNALNVNLSSIYATNCNWSASIVNQVLHEINIGALSGFTGRVVSIGGTNSDPDATSGGYDGLTAKANLEAKGITVNIA